MKIAYMIKEGMKLVVEDVRIESLVANSWNSNMMTPENEDKLKASIVRFGFFRPVLARTLDDGTLEIVGGEHRVSVAKKLGYESVPTINLGSIDDRKAKEILLTDNGRYGEDDTLALAELLKDLGDVDDLLGFLPYTGDELESIFMSSSISLDDLDIPDDDGHASDLPTKTAQTHQVMRFKVPIEDSDYIQRSIESTMKSQGFTKDDSMTNAGNALVHLIRSIK